MSTAERSELASELPKQSAQGRAFQRGGAGGAGEGGAGRGAPSGHAEWEPSPIRRDPVELLEEQAETRVPELVPIRYGRMLVSPFTFYRGAAYLMAADLAGTPRTGLHTQLCGDAHLSNFGAFAAPDRRLVFSVNDFDETLPGPFEWDVKRLVASFAVAGRDRGFDDKTARQDQPGRSDRPTGRRSGASRRWATSTSGTPASTSTRSSGRSVQQAHGRSSASVPSANLAKTPIEGQPEGVREADRDRRRRAAHHRRPARGRRRSRTSSRPTARTSSTSSSRA